MSNGWTGGQYSLFRAIFGACLFVHFAGLIPRGAKFFSSPGAVPPSASPLMRLFPNMLAVSDVPAIVAVALAIAAIASIAFMAGYYDRAAAVVMCYVLACLFGRDPLLANPVLTLASWLLVAHAFMPPAPYGSWSARGRSDPRGGWSMPPAIFAAAWIAMSAGYAYSGYEKLLSPSWLDGTAVSHVLNGPLARPGFARDAVLAAPTGVPQMATWVVLALELSYAPLALFRRARPWIWIAMAGMHVGSIVLVNVAELSLGMLVLHLFTLDPQWIPARWSARRDRILYDGTCGLCHRAVRFVLSEDRQGTAFAFSPLPDDSDSLVVKTEEGRLLGRSDATIYVLERLGGLWRAMAVVLRVVPRAVRDFVYDFIARRRYEWFGREATACPIVPPDLRARFHGRADG